jgi:hypothetical protein
MCGEHVKQNRWFHCFFDLFCIRKQMQICGGFTREFASHVHRMFTGLKKYTVEVEKRLKNLVLGALIRVLVNVYEGYRNASFNFALYENVRSGVVKQNHFASPFASLLAFCFTGGGWNG